MMYELADVLIVHKISRQPESMVLHTQSKLLLMLTGCV